MYQFFIADSQTGADHVVIEGSDVNHIKNVLRMKTGERIRVSTQAGKNYFCSISDISSETVVADIISEDTEGTELPCEIYLFQGLPKSDKMELIIQKAVELGASHIVPVAMKNCVAKLDEKKASSKVARWQEIAKSAAKQSKRSIIPDISMPVTYKQALDMAAGLDVILIAYENECGMAEMREAIEGIKPGDKVALFVGPEGGFDPSEIALAAERFHINISADEPGKTARAHIISLGRRILRTETAGLAALSIIMYSIEQP
jgi:16S rRNA (uracil1498-N3)-methyltransferase